MAAFGGGGVGGGGRAAPPTHLFPPSSLIWLPDSTLLPAYRPRLARLSTALVKLPRPSGMVCCLRVCCPSTGVSYECRGCWEAAGEGRGSGPALERLASQGLCLQWYCKCPDALLCSLESPGSPASRHCPARPAVD